MALEIKVASYTASVRRWLARTDHYLKNAPPSCLICVVAIQDTWTLAGICLLIATPYLRVLQLSAAFARSRERRFLALSLTVFLLMSLGAFLGARG